MRSVLAALGALLVAACGFDWTVVDDAGKGGVKCGSSICASDAYCSLKVDAKGDVLSSSCLAWSCASRSCTCSEIGACACATPQGGVVVTCTAK
jgi:hypothetical protein